MEESIVSIVVRDVVGKEMAISSEDASKLYAMVSKAMEKGQIVHLSFKGISLVVSAFLNIAIGQLYSSFTSEQLGKQLKVTDIQSDDRKLFQDVLNKAREYYSDKASFQEAMKNQGIADDDHKS